MRDQHVDTATKTKSSAEAKTKTPSFAVDNDPRYEQVRAILAKRAPLASKEKKELLSRIKDTLVEVVGGGEHEHATKPTTIAAEKKLREIVSDLNRTGPTARQRDKCWTPSYAASVLAAFYVCVEALRDDAVDTRSDSSRKGTGSGSIGSESDATAITTLHGSPQRAALESIANRIREAVATTGDERPQTLPTTNPSEPRGPKKNDSVTSKATGIIGTDANTAADTNPVAPATMSTDKLLTRLSDLARDYDSLAKREEHLLELLQNLEHDADILVRALAVESVGDEDTENEETTANYANERPPSAIAAPKRASGESQVLYAKGDTEIVQTIAHSDDDQGSGSNGNDEDVTGSRTRTSKPIVRKRKTISLSQRERPSKEEKGSALRKLEEALFMEDDSDDDSDSSMD